jgi:hypothetical protein
MDPAAIEELPKKRNRSTGESSEDCSDDEVIEKKPNDCLKIDETFGESDIKHDLTSDEEFDLIEYLKDKEDDDLDQSDEDSDDDNDDEDESDYSDDN